MRNRLLPWLALVVVLAMAAIVVGIDLVVPPVDEPPSRMVSASDDPVAGSRVCAVGTGGEGRLATFVLAQPDQTTAASTQVEIERISEGGRRVHTPDPLSPGADERVTFRSAEADLSAGVVRWRGEPTAVWREWNLEDDDLPPGTVAGPCAAPSSPRWTIPGLSTQGGDEARVRLANPFATAATFAVSFLSPDGDVRPLALQNLTVPASSVREIEVDEFLPEEADLAAVVEVITGRLSVEGIQIARQEIGDVDGTSLLAASATAAEQWTVPWIIDDDDASSWLWIANATDRAATVELTLHTADGGVVPTGLAEAGVPAEHVRRVDLTGTFPEDVEVVAVTARSNGVPVAVSAGTRLTSEEDVDRTGLAVQLGVPDVDDTWVVAGTGRYDRTEELHVVNPTGEAAQVDIALVLGEELHEPAALQQIAMPAGSSRIVPLTDEVGEAGWTALVTATEGGVIVGRVGQTPEDAGPARLVASPGQPSASWAAVEHGLQAEASDQLTRHLRTSLGLGERP